MIQKLNLHRILVRAINRNRTIIMNSCVGIEFECEDDIYIYGDEKWLIFLISQILLNSVKYRRKEGAKIILSSEKKNKKVILKIWDNGTGIKEEELPRIFEKGFTGSNGRENERSTGIGLYLVKKLCQKLDMEVVQRIYFCLSIASGKTKRLILKGKFITNGCGEFAFSNGEQHISGYMTKL